MHRLSTGAVKYMSYSCLKSRGLKKAWYMVMRVDQSYSGEKD